VKLIQRLRSRFQLLRQNFAYRNGTRAIKLAGAILAAAIVASLTIDLGPSLRQFAERGGTDQLKRPIHIGRLSLHVLRGSVVVEDLQIDGVKPSDRPFFVAKRIELGLDWTKVLRRHPEFIISSVEMTDWRMLVEKWAGGRNNFPKFTNNDKPDNGPRPFTITLKSFQSARGRFLYEDHETPWSVDGPNLDLTITNLPHYHGTAKFHGGTIKIQDHLPMWGDFDATFELDGPRVHLPRILINTDGAETIASGDVDFAHWPTMRYDVKSRVHFPRMREIFFTNEKWRLAGDGDFTGVFRLYDHGHNLSGTFASQTFGVSGLPLPGLYGKLQWNENGFDVWDAGSKFYAGDAHFKYSIKPFGKPEPTTQRFEVTFARTDLAPFSDFELPRNGMHFAGAADGHVYLEWTSGKFNQRRGVGQIAVTPPPGVTLMTASLVTANAADADHTRHEWGPFAPQPLPAHYPVGGQLTFKLDPAQWQVEGGELRTEKSHVRFDGAADFDMRGRFNFHVVSRDFQEADQLLIGIMNDFGSHSSVVAFGGRGEFDGTMTGQFRRPRVEGSFRGDDVWAWDTLWGDASARLVIENDYVDIRDGVALLNGSEIHADGKFSLGYPRSDKGDEIDAVFRVVRRDIASLRHGFQKDEYPITGLFSGEMHLTGPYERPVGFGAMTIEDGRAYGQPMRKATASLRFDGKGIRLDAIDIAINNDTARSGNITGAAYIGWDSTYSFNATGRGIPVSNVAATRFEKFPVTGVAEFTADGSGTFEIPRNNFRFSVSRLALGEEPLGDLTGNLTLRGNELSGDVAVQLQDVSLTGTGRVALTPQADAELSFRFHDSPLDRYIRLFRPNFLPETTGAKITGSVRVMGELANMDHLAVDATIDSLELQPFDFLLRNAEPMHVVLEDRTLKLPNLKLVGDATELSVTGEVGLNDERISLSATGNASLGILQIFSKDIKGSGKVELRASVDGPLRAPVFSGNAIITNGRIRKGSLPNALETINGAIRFDSRGIQLDELTASIGGGPIQFGGRVNLDGYLPGELNVLITGQNIKLRYPADIQSIVDVDLTLRGNMQAPVVGGTVNVQSAVWTRRLDAPGSIFDLASRLASSSDVAPGFTEVESVPIRFDLEINAPSAFKMDTNLLQLTASADLTLQGTYEKPILLGRAEVDRGQLNFEARRYRVTRGTVDFTNRSRIEPFIDLEGETNVRVPGQNYRVVVSATGTPGRLNIKLESDPPLPEAEVAALLLGGSDVQPGSVRGTAPELARLQDPNRTETDILRTRATQMLSDPLSTEVQRVFKQTFGVDTFQLSPSLTDPSALTSRLNPTARITIGTRISDRAYITFSRSLNSTYNDQILLLEYEVSDRFNWVLTRSEDSQTYALEFRVRHSF
jgi:hypothetical protein